MQTANDNKPASWDAEFIAMQLTQAFLEGFLAGLEEKPRKIIGYTSSGNGSAIPAYGEDKNEQV